MTTSSEDSRDRGDRVAMWAKHWGVSAGDLGNLTYTLRTTVDVVEAVNALPAATREKVTPQALDQLRRILHSG